MKKTDKTIRGKLITKENPRSPIAETYRTIRSNIDFSMVDETLKTLVITSSSPAEGKSTTLSNLAVTFAQTEKKVLLVDADLRRPTIHQQFRLDNTKGLTTVLTKKASLEDATAKTNIENLWVLTSGPIPPNPSELLNSKAMATFLEEWKQHFDLIIFDAPPLLAVTDAQILGSKCDGVLLVVRSNQTKKDELIRAKSLLDKANARIIGSILYGVNPKEMSAQYYYYGK